MASGTEIERLIVRLVGDATQYQRTLARAQADTTGFVRRIGRSLLSLRGLAMGALAGAGAAAPFAYAIKSASDLEETMSKFGVVFGEAAGPVKQWGDELAAQVGRSEQQVASFLSGAQDLFVPLGFDPKRAEEMSKTITRLAIDLGSFNNMTDADTMRDLQAALTGSGEVMKKYGVIVSEAAVKQQLLNAGLDPTKATDQQKVMARLQIILAGTTAAQGDAVRTAGGFANQMKALRGSLQDTAAQLGQHLLPLATFFVGKIRDAVLAIREWITANSDLIQSWIGFVTNFGTNTKILWQWFKDNWWNILKDVGSMFITAARNWVNNFKVGIETMLNLGKVLGQFLLDVLSNPRQWKAAFQRAVDEAAKAVTEGLADIRLPLEGFESSITELPEFVFDTPEFLQSANQAGEEAAYAMQDAFDAAGGIDVGKAVEAADAVAVGSAEAARRLAEYQSRQSRTMRPEDVFGGLPRAMGEAIGGQPDKLIETGRQTVEILRELLQTSREQASKLDILPAPLS